MNRRLYLQHENMRKYIDVRVQLNQTKSTWAMYGLSRDSKEFFKDTKTTYPSFQLLF